MKYVQRTLAGFQSFSVSFLHRTVWKQILSVADPLSQMATLSAENGSCSLPGGVVGSNSLPAWL